MKIISLNANGIRAAARKGFFTWLEKQTADVVCIQETKAQIHQLKDAMFHPAGFHCYYHDAEKPGYSGTAIYSRHEPNTVKYGLGLDYLDKEGRYLEVQFDDVCVVSLYMQSGSSSETRQQIKFQFMDDFMPYLRSLQDSHKEYIICGDWNIAHKAIDLKNWKSNQKNSGFLPEERAWMDELLDDVGFIDAFRSINLEPEQYTWWSNRGQAWAKNVGWRIDYQITTAGLKDTVEHAEIYKEERFSDHAPLIIDYKLTLRT